jgi:glycosyltransferase involved in cell wall biosynthesis
LRIAFAIESLRLSGGHIVITEHAARLSEQHGHDVTLIDVFEQGHMNWGFRGLESVTVCGISDLEPEPFDLVVATWWETVAKLAHIPSEHYAYFVQSIEDRWYPAGSPEHFLASLTYAIGLPVITEAHWISQVLSTAYPSMSCHVVPNGVDKDLFPVGTQRPLEGQGPLRVLLEGGGGHSPLKGVADAIDALGAVREPLAVTVVGDSGDLDLPQGFSQLPAVPQDQLSELYANHDLLLKMSRVEGMYGPPLEAFHRGATVVTTPVTGHEEFVVHGHNALVCDWDDPVGTARLLDQLSRDRPMLARLRRAALETADAWPGWPESTTAMAKTIDEIRGRSAVELSIPLAMYSATRRHAAETADHLHGQGLKLDKNDAHIEKLTGEWAYAHGQIDLLQQERQELESSTEALREALDNAEVRATTFSAANEILLGNNLALQAALNRRFGHRIVEYLRRLRRSRAEFGG